MDSAYTLSDDGKAVVRADTGKVIKRHPTHGQARTHLKILQANEKKSPSQKSLSFKQGARHSASDQKAIQSIHDQSTFLGALCQGESQNAKMTALAGGKSLVDQVKATLTPAQNAAVNISESSWDIKLASDVLSNIMSLLAMESQEEDADDSDVQELCATAQLILQYISGELDEMQSENGSAPALSAKPSPALLSTTPLLSPNGTKAISRREDISPADKERAVREYGDVKFADEKNKKYPIDTEAHIRAGWNYINKGNNAGKYSAEEVDQIKNRIIAAWKDKIDPAGPPSAREGKKSLNITYIKSLHLPQQEEYYRDVVAVKSTGLNRIRGYLVLWGDPTVIDVENDFFTSAKSILGATDFWDSRLALPKPLTWDHAQDPSTKSAPLIGHIDAMGDDDIGRWYEAQLDTAYKYRAAIDRLISERAIGTSSDSAPQYVIRVPQKSGARWLKQWPLFAAALTPTPCEPRMLDEGSLFWKSLGLNPKIAQPWIGPAPDGARLEELNRMHESLRSFVGQQDIREV